jgi:threonine aldolase
MRQAGIFAAAANYGLDHHMSRLAEDHANAALIARRLSACRAVVLDPAAVQTNIIVFVLASDAPDAPTVVARVRDRGVLAIAFGPRTIRLVTHLDVSRAQCERAADVLADVLA